MSRQETSVLGEDWFGSAHPADDDLGVLGLALVGEAPAALEAPDAIQELSDVLAPPPLAVADHVQAHLLLHANRKQHQVVQDSLETLGRQGISLGEEVADDLGPRQGPDAVGEKGR